MRDTGVGRVLVASLHQSIADILPDRLAFYENWLNSEGLREGTIGVAPLYAVLSFLRLEGDGYHTITTRAGEYAADWTVQSLAPTRCRLMHAAPTWLRRRLVLRLAQHVVRSSYRGTRVIARINGGAVRLDLRASVFCTVRAPVGRPLCGFYAAAVSRLLTLFELDGRTEVVACRGVGESTCLLNVVPAGGASAAMRQRTTR